MAAVTSLSFSAFGQYSERKVFFCSSRTFISNFDSFRVRTNFASDSVGIRSSSANSRVVIRCLSAATDVPTVSETKLNFLKTYKRPIPSVYNTVLQELIVQQHLMRNDAKKLEEWARAQTASSLAEFSSRKGEVEGILKDIAERAGGKGSFSYSRFFAIGLFRLLELANATEPTILEKLCQALNINKRSVDRDLDVYRNLLSKLVQAKELLKEYVDREKKKREERTESQKANEAITKCTGDYQYAGY
ncbi:protein THYLAKOID FORMATION1, chloroplastic isoform X2 [Malania oleifera]|uniref:protein THYLAKOID FORMATION1, chloroplastic isoform X2 n=1 Tax=Malania oleifera TaxID=397392 RepID=UPI0025ADA68C|nr:protein THYLAKOID FORMATION1, chloroplastic isoform X2 [Malania oleifera]